MNRFIKLILILLSIYGVVFIGLAINFFIQYPVFNGISVIIYLIIFVLAIIMLTFTYDKKISKFLAYPMYFTLVIGFRTFYMIFIQVDDLAIGPEPKYGFNYFINHTFFTVENYQTFKIAEASVFLVLVNLLFIGTLLVYLRTRKGSIKDNYTVE